MTSNTQKIYNATQITTQLESHVLIGALLRRARRYVTEGQFGEEEFANNIEFAATWAVMAAELLDGRLTVDIVAHAVAGIQEEGGNYSGGSSWLSEYYSRFPAWE